jgi:L-iditol 2-dehydrogenase
VESASNARQASTIFADDVAFSGVPPYDGSIRRYHTHNAKFLHKLPAALSFAEGALLEPLSVVLHAFERSPLRLGETTVICGAGPIGLVALAVAKASGAVPLIITDIDAHRLEFAKTFVPSCETVLVPLESKPEDTAASILDTVRSLGAEQPRVVYECTGVQSSVITAAFLPRPKGEVMVVGVGRPVLNELPFMHLALAEVRSA